MDLELYDTSCKKIFLKKRNLKLEILQNLIEREEQFEIWKILNLIYVAKYI